MTTPTLAIPEALATDRRPTIFSKPNCGQCDTVKRWFKDRSIAFHEKNALDEDVIAAAKGLGIMSAPIVSLPSGVVFGGFRPDKLDAEFPAYSFPKIEQAGLHASI